MSPGATGRGFLLDADAFIALRSLSLLKTMCGSASLPRPLGMTQYVARHELSTLAFEIGALEQSGILKVHPVLARSEQGQNWKRLLREGVDKGEAESIAWAMGQDRSGRPLFVSVEPRARQAAEREGVPNGDLMDLVVDLVERGIVDRESARGATGIWEDRRQQLGRPRDFTTFDETYERRRARHSH